MLGLGARITTRWRVQKYKSTDIFGYDSIITQSGENILAQDNRKLVVQQRTYQYLVASDGRQIITQSGDSILIG